jgi:hypothetical protein
VQITVPYTVFFVAADTKKGGTMSKTNKEGWILSLNTEKEKLEIQKDDDSSIFKNDAQALAYVKKKAKAGSAPHKKVLALVS